MIQTIEVLIGLGMGLAVGSGFVALLTLLRIIPRLIQLTRTKYYLKVYISSVILGTLFGVFLSFTKMTWDEAKILLALWGILHGTFNGMIAASLAEILNVIPILFRRIKAEKYLIALLMAIVCGKIVGSLFQWLIFVKMS